MNENHECTWDTIEWEYSAGGTPYYDIAGQGELLERKGVCQECGRELVERYQKLGVYFKDSNEEAF